MLVDCPSWTFCKEIAVKSCILKLLYTFRLLRSWSENQKTLLERIKLHKVRLGPYPLIKNSFLSKYITNKNLLFKDYGKTFVWIGFQDSCSEQYQKIESNIIIHEPVFFLKYKELLKWNTKKSLFHYSVLSILDICHMW